VSQILRFHRRLLPGFERLRQWLHLHRYLVGCPRGLRARYYRRNLRRCQRRQRLRRLGSGQLLLVLWMVRCYVSCAWIDVHKLTVLVLRIAVLAASQAPASPAAARLLLRRSLLRL
jgi:hypothetical protein